MNSSVWVGGLTVCLTGVDCGEWCGSVGGGEGRDVCVTWNGGGRGPALAHCDSLPIHLDPRGLSCSTSCQ